MRPVSAWHSLTCLQLVPHPQPYTSAREALIYGLLFVSLGMIVWHRCALGMAVIDRLVPGPGDYEVWGGAGRWSIASLIAFTPVLVMLDRRVSRGGDDAGRGRSLVRKWFASVQC